MLKYGGYPRSLVLMAMALLIATVVDEVLSRKAVNDTKTLANSLLSKATEPVDTPSRVASTAIAGVLVGRTLEFSFDTVGVVNVSTVGPRGGTDVSDPPLVATLLSELAQDAQADVDDGGWPGPSQDAGHLLESGGVTGSPVAPDKLLAPGALATAVAIGVVVREPRAATPRRPNHLASLAALGLLPAALASKAPVAPGFRAVISEPAALTALGIGLLAVGNQLRKARRARSERHWS